jgi:hypothetical protein
MGSRLLSLCAAAVCVLAAVSASGAAASGSARVGCSTKASTLAVADCARLPVVASLDARYSTGRPRFRYASRSADCRPAELVFYAARDWLRLGAKLAEHASPCADYYISIPPLVADKTNARPNQAWRIRRLGSRFHALAEIHWATWLSWARENGRSMFDAGVEARRRMAAAGFDVAAGDSWAVNELPSSVRRDLGTARDDAQQFLRGLYEGDGRRVQGAVFVIGVMHGTSDASLYKSTLKSWFSDTPFWIEARRSVRFWAQEVYGDTRRWGVPGSASYVRRTYLNDFLQHAARLAAVAPDRYGVASTFLARSHTPIANAGWQWPSGLGWTMVSGAQMQAFVSSQTYALREYASASPGPDRFGFAWAPNNATGLSNTSFVAASGQLLDRLGGALAASSESRFEPDAWAAADVVGASFTDAWRIFSVWDQVLDAVAAAHRRLGERVRTILPNAKSRPVRARPR